MTPPGGALSESPPVQQLSSRGSGEEIQTLTTERDQLKARVQELEIKVEELSLPKIENLSFQSEITETITKYQQEAQKWQDKHHKLKILYGKLEKQFEELDVGSDPE